MKVQNLFMALPRLWSPPWLNQGLLLHPCNIVIVTIVWLFSRKFSLPSYYSSPSLYHFRHRLIVFMKILAVIIISFAPGKKDDQVVKGSITVSPDTFSSSVTDQVLRPGKKSFLPFFTFAWPCCCPCWRRGRPACCSCGSSPATPCQTMSPGNKDGGPGRQGHRRENETAPQKFEGWTPL